MLALVMSGLSSRCAHLGLESTRAVGARTEKLRDEAVRLGLVRWCLVAQSATILNAPKCQYDCHEQPHARAGHARAVDRLSRRCVHLGLESTRAIGEHIDSTARS